MQHTAVKIVRSGDLPAEQKRTEGQTRIFALAFKGIMQPQNNSVSTSCPQCSSLPN